MLFFFALLTSLPRSCKVNEHFRLIYTYSLRMLCRTLLFSMGFPSFFFIVAIIRYRASLFAMLLLFSLWYVCCWLFLSPSSRKVELREMLSLSVFVLTLMRLCVFFSFVVLPIILSAIKRSSAGAWAHIPQYVCVLKHKHIPSVCSKPIYQRGIKREKRRKVVRHNAFSSPLLTYVCVYAVIVWKSAWCTGKRYWHGMGKREKHHYDETNERVRERKKTTESANGRFTLTQLTSTLNTKKKMRNASELPPEQQTHQRQ